MKLSRKIRIWNQAVHRDLGYLFSAMTIIYAISGIALNHLKDWDPNYSIEARDIQVAAPIQKEGLTKDAVRGMLADLGEAENYKSHYFPRDSVLKVFIDGGSLAIDMETGEGLLETTRRRPVFFEVNFLHYNTPRKLFTWYSDIFAGALIVMALSGLFILKGKKGITGRGAWLTAIGILIPTIFLIIYL
jgi:uncharacterized protein